MESSHASNRGGVAEWRPSGDHSGGGDSLGHHEVASGTLADIVQRAGGLAPPATIVIGAVAAQRSIQDTTLDQGRDLVEDLRVGQGLPVSHGLTVQDG